jgi:hypothetical protein
VSAYTYMYTCRTKYVDTCMTYVCVHVIHTHVRIHVCICMLKSNCGIKFDYEITTYVIGGEYIYKLWDQLLLLY